MTETSDDPIVEPKATLEVTIVRADGTTEYVGEFPADITHITEA